MPQISRKRRAPPQEESQDVSEAESQPRTQRRRLSPASEDETFGEGEAMQGDSSLDQMVKNLVRLALASEYSRTPIRRTDITTKVLGTQSRQFKPVFSAAQLQLRAVFGMEMTELPVRDRITIAQKRAAAKSQSTQKTSSAWILTSALPARFREPDVLPPPQTPTAEVEAQYVALYTFIVALISLSGGSLADARLDRYLSRANVNEVTPFAHSLAVNAIDKTEKLMKRMERDGYIVKIKDTSSGEELVEWIVGPRGKVEVGDEGVRGLVKTVYDGEDGSEELERKLQRSLGVAERRALADAAAPSTAKKPARKKNRNTAEDDAEEEEASDEG